MKRLALVLLASAAAFGQIQPSTLPTSPNWGKPHYYNSANDAFQNGAFSVPIVSPNLGFQFTVPANRSTSAVVINAAGTTLKHLWSNRRYAPGTYGSIWDGTNDQGGAVSSGGPFTVLLQYNNVNFNWDGILGDTSPDLFGPYTWGQTTLALPQDMVSIGANGIAANGYDEGTFEATVFPLATPMVNEHPIPPQAIGNPILTKVATDGNLAYFLMHVSTAGDYSGVVAFDAKGNLHNFSSGTLVPSAQQYFRNSSDINNIRSLTVQACDTVTNPTFHTGIAVQRSGNILATAIAGSNVINLHDKGTCAAAGTAITITSPQRMTFDLNGNLWVISGTITGAGSANVLSEVTSVGTSNTITTPIAGLLNPVSVSVSPVTGNIFVMDGGTHQQIFEYNASTYALVRTLGVAGGYGQGSSCNASVSPYKFWVDYYGRDGGLQMDTETDESFVNVGDNGELEVMDSTTGQMYFYTLQSGNWTYENKRVMFEPFQHTMSLAINDATRIFQGRGSMLEFSRDYSKPMVPGDPDPNQGGNGAWTLKNNWWPCIQSATGYRASPSIPRSDFVWVSPTNGNTYMYMQDQSNNASWATLNSNGSATVEAITGFYYPWFAPAGGYYSFSYNSATHTMFIKSSTVTGYDASTMPVVSAASNIFSFPALYSAGDPIPNTNTQITPATTTNGVFATLARDANTAYTGTTQAYHVGGFKLNDTAYRWEAMPEKDIAWPTGDGDFPSANVTGLSYTGGAIQAVGDYIIAQIGGNYTPASGCQYMLYNSDGLFIGQFGYMQRFSSTPSGQNSWGANGVTSVGLYENKSPGFCGDINYFQAGSNGSNIEVFYPDESVFHGLHEWTISNLSSVTEMSCTTTQGSTCTLH